MKNTALRSQSHLLQCTNLTTPSPNSPPFIPIKVTSQLKNPNPKHPSIKLTKTAIFPRKAALAFPNPVVHIKFTDMKQEPSRDDGFLQVFSYEHSRFLVLGALSLGFVWFLIDQKALALGPEGPLVEEFWENVRRYGLYALTVSTGALYTMFQPIGELFKNPFSAVLLLLIFVGSFYVLSQVLSVMLGIADFSYDYGY